MLVFAANLLWSYLRGEKAGGDPWDAWTLEWATSSPPPFDNFGGHHPVVYRGPDEYGVENPDGTDFIMQTSPAKSA